MNQALGNVGKTVIHTEPLEAEPVDQIESLRELVRDMDSGAVEMLVILGANPIYTAPADIPFAEKFAKVKLRVRLGLYDDETSELCHWHIPAAHYLETWGDTRAYDGTVTIQQPLIAPLYRGKSPQELLALFSDQPERSAHDVVKDYWQHQKPSPDFETWWRKSVHDGVVEGTAAPAKTVSAKPVGQVPDLPSVNGLEIIFRPDPTIYDGRFANNGWLQELPKPLTKLTWDNAALISPATAQRLNLENMAEIELQYAGRTVKAPVWITPGHAADSITIHLGYGRRRAGRRPRRRLQRLSAAHSRRPGSPRACRFARPAASIRSPRLSITGGWKAAIRCAPEPSPNSRPIPSSCKKWKSCRPRRSRSIRRSSTKATPGAWRSI